jgi:hypothetical protein
MIVHTQDNYASRDKEIRNERLGGRRRNRTADEDGEKESTGKLNGTPICTNRVKEDAHAVKSGGKSRGVM